VEQYGLPCRFPSIDVRAVFKEELRNLDVPFFSPLQIAETYIGHK
jgi:hypothetical protein